MPAITPCLWMDDEGEEAAAFYVSVFPNSRILGTVAYNDVGPGEAGKTMLVEFELDGTAFTIVNGGPLFTFDEAVSFQIDCGSQDEVDHYWDALVDGGSESQCGWLKDRYGLSWQVVPRQLKELTEGRDPAVAARVMEALLQMKRIDIAALEAAAGATPAG
jgi:predicted 3-demethylubiquinone-9 3-methyltransferase (glyoxalase superfamily)